MPGKIQAAFLKTFWSDLREHLADVVKEEVADWSVRPNMVIAAALENSPLSPQQKMHILARAEQKLVTKRGLRTLSPNHLRYEGEMCIRDRDEHKEEILIRYTLEESPEPVTLRFQPFLAFRNFHSLSKANLFVNRKFTPLKNGISVRLYEGYPDLYMQFSKKNEFIPVPDWYYNIEYLQELNRGYEYLEDLFVPGYFELTMKPGEIIIFSAGTGLAAPVALKQRFTKEMNKRVQRYTFLNTLKSAADQFIFKKGTETGIIAGFPWYDGITRQTFISLPGLVAGTGKKQLFPEVLSTYRKYLKNGLFPDNIHSKEPSYTSADSSLWFIWAVQQYAKRCV